MDAPAPNGLYLDAVITPHRSLKRRGLIVLIAVMVSLNILLGVVFVAMGAPPVPVFLGLDVLGVLLAFWISYRQGRRRERVRADAREVRVISEIPRGSAILWTSPSARTRVVFEAPGEHECRVRLVDGDAAITVGGQLSPPERRGLYIAIDDALRAARRVADQ